MKKLIAYCLSLLLATPVFGANTSKRFFENSGGLVDHISPLLIPDRNASAITNVSLDDRGQLSKRNGYLINNTTGTLGPVTWPVTGLGYHTAAATSGTSFLGVVVGTDVYRTSNSFGGTYSLITGTVAVTNSSSNLAQTTSINDVMVVCNESDPPFKIPVTGNAVILNGAPTKAHTCATYGNYLILGNTTESSTDFPSRIRWSDINTVDSFPSNNYIDVEPNDGDKVVSVVSFEDSVYVFKKRSIHRLIITGDTGANAFIIRPVARGIGAWSKNSVKVLNNIGIMFLGQNITYLFDGRSFDPVGDSIQRTFDGLNRAMWANSVGAVYPKRSQYWLSVSSTSTTNAEVLVYDYIQKAWTVYTGMGVNALTQAEDSTGASTLVSGDYKAAVYKQDTGSVDTPANVSTAISATYTTGDLTFDTPDITKGFKYLYVYTQVNSSTNLTVKAAYDFQSVFESTQTVTLGQVGALYGTAIYGIDSYPALLYKVTRLELNRSARAVKLQLVNADSTGIFGVIGWTVVYSLEDFKQ